MPVALMLPTSNGRGTWSGEQPVMEAKRYVRGPNNSRWHRVRSAVFYPQYNRICYSFWCGPSGSDPKDGGVLFFQDETPQFDDTCGTCVGRALGAKQDDLPLGLPPLRFDPRWQKAPPTCPGSNSRTLWTPVGYSGSAGLCLVCGDTLAIRCVGKGYYAYGAGPVRHKPGPHLADPCPFHAWQRLDMRDGKVRCMCGWPQDLGRVNAGPG